MNNLPVRPDFVEALKNTAFEIANEALKDAGVPQDLIDLVGNIVFLDSYLVDVYRSPESFNNQHRFVEESIVDTINGIGKYSGKAWDPSADLAPTEEPQKAEKQAG